MTKKVLLIDDHLLDITLTRQALSDCSIPHKMIASLDGAEGLTQLKRGDFDVVILDLKMPRVDGFEVLEAMRRMPELAKLPVIVLSGSNLQADRDRARDLGAVEYVQKALDFQEFKLELKSALSRHGFC